MDDFLHNLRSGKLKQGGQSNRSYNDPQYKGGLRRNNNNNMMDRRKGHHDNKESSERLGAINKVLESLAETQKRMAEAYQARTRAEERKARAIEVLAKNLYKMLNPTATDVDELFAPEIVPVVEPIPAPKEVVPPPVSNLKAVVESTLFEDEESFDEPDDDVEMDVEAGPSDADDDNDDAVDADCVDGDGEENEAEEDDNAGNVIVGETRGRLTEVDRHTLFAVITQMRAKGEGWEKIARHVSAQGYPTISGKGSWRGIMVKTLYEKMETE